MGSAVSLTTMTDSLHPHNSNPRKKASPHAVSSFYPDGVFHLKFSLLDAGSGSASGSARRMSPGWHESASPIALSVESAGEEPEGSRMAVFEGWGELLCG
jgi:hypothetical protein